MTELTTVERAALRSSPFKALYPPAEKMRTIVVGSFPALGKLAAMRFIEWVQDNPGGVISLPTGKTPEHFIKWTTHILETWDSSETRAELEKRGVDPAKHPDMHSLHFVQIDEFYPINPRQHNSFFHYVNRYYIGPFGLDAEKAMLIDCSKIGLEDKTLASVWPNDEVNLSLRYRPGNTDLERTQKKALERIDQWCQEYEDRIRTLGGIGFFLGGIGPDGHIGFNVRGSDHHSTTRLTKTNYETQAAAATDLGGIEISRRRLVITIGLGTITYNPECTAIILAAGATKAGIVAAAVRKEKHLLYPATVLHDLPNARFYVTRGAARFLAERQLELVTNTPRLSGEETDRILINLAVRKRKRLADLDAGDFESDPFAAAVLEKRAEGHNELALLVRDNLVRKIERGMQTLSSAHFFHTEPHHDDLMLGCLPYIVRHIRDTRNTHDFVCLTSGFTSVSNRYMKEQLARLREFIDSSDFAELAKEDYFEPRDMNGRNRDVWQYLDGVAAKSDSMKDEGTARRFLRNLVEVYGERTLDDLKRRVSKLEDYFRTAYPGKKDSEDIQRLKGTCREWEAECLWGYFGWNCTHVMHLRLGFYTGEVFTEEPTPERDVLPVLRALEKVKPDVVTVALDPEASGPDTHYKVLQAVAEALRRYEEKTGRSDIKVWGYRNVWYRFHPAEADIFVPISLNMFSIMQSAFVNAYVSQKDASFPSYEHDGPFSELTQRIQVEQYQMIKTCLGRDWFHESTSATIRGARGLLFLKELALPELYEHTREIRSVTEDS